MASVMLPPSLGRRFNSPASRLPQASVLNGDSILYVHVSSSGQLKLSNVCSVTGVSKSTVMLPDAHYDQLHFVRLNSSHLGLCYRHNGLHMRRVSISNEGSLTVDEPVVVLEFVDGSSMGRVTSTGRHFLAAAWTPEGRIFIYDLGACASLPVECVAKIDNFPVEEVAAIGRKLYFLRENEVGIFDLDAGDFKRHPTQGYVRSDVAFMEFEQTAVWRNSQILVLNGVSELWRLDVQTFKWHRLAPLASFPDVHIPCFSINDDGYLLVMTVFDFFDEQSEVRMYWIAVPPLEMIAKIAITAEDTVSL